MAGELSGRVALITGGGGEIGGAIARRFAEAGAAIAIADVRREGAEAIAAEIIAAGGQAVSVRTNVTVEQDAERAVRHAVEAFGKLTTLVNVAAAVTPDSTVETLTLDDWNEALAVNREFFAAFDRTVETAGGPRCRGAVPPHGARRCRLRADAARVPGARSSQVGRDPRGLPRADRIST